MTFLAAPVLLSLRGTFIPASPGSVGHARGRLRKMVEEVKEASPRFKARMAGVFYLLTFVTGMLALFFRGRWGLAAGLVAGACYVVVTVLFYFLFKPVNTGLSLLAAVVSLVGCAIGPLSLAVPAASRINPLVFFGFYCLLIAYLIFRSTFLPRILGALMALAGLGWLTFVSPALARYLSPYNMVPGILGEGSLTVWLLVMGVNAPAWEEQARAAEEGRSQHAMARRRHGRPA